MKGLESSKLLTFNLFVLFGLYLMFYESSTNAEATDTELSSQIDHLTQLNQNYLLAYSNGNTEWFDKHLSDDFTETDRESHLLSKADFLEKISGVSGDNIVDTTASELSIRIIGKLAIVQAIPVRTLVDGSTISGGRYTDIYYNFDGQWLCVAAQLGGLSP